MRGFVALGIVLACAAMAQAETHRVTFYAEFEVPAAAVLEAPAKPEVVQELPPERSMTMWTESRQRRLGDGSVASVTVTRAAPMGSVQVRSSSGYSASASCSSGSCSSGSCSSSTTVTASRRGFFGRWGDRVRMRRADRRERRAVRAVARL